MSQTLPKSSVENLLVGTLKVDKAYQRTIRPSQVKKIVNDYCREAFGVLLVGRRESGTCFIVDGQQRWHAAKKLELVRVPCAVFDSEGKAHEAAVFKMVNKDRTGVPPLIVYRSCLWAGDKETLAIDSIVRECGFKVPHGSNKTWPNLSCASALYTVFRRSNGGELLRDTLSVVSQAWNGQQTALHRTAVLGVANFLFKCRDHELDIIRLTEVLENTKPEHLMGDAEAARKLVGGSREQVVAMAILKLYNKRLRNKIVWE